MLIGIRKLRIVIIQPASGSVTGGKPVITHDCPEYLSFLKERDAKFFNVILPQVSIKKRPAIFLSLIKLLHGADLVINSEYFNSAITSAILRLTGSKARHVVIGLNISSNRTLKTKSRVVNRFLDWLGFSRIDMAIVASQPEADIFSKYHHIPRDRFSFVHWAYDLPKTAGKITPPRRQYFCMIGRNNRDHHTFCAAMTDLDADGVIIGKLADGLVPPQNVHALGEIGLPDCIEYIRNSAANVILVRDAERGAGHITIVTAMHCARPQIISDVPTALDYFIADKHALTVPIGDPIAVRNAMQKILDNPSRANKMGESAYEYAKTWLSHSKRTAILSERLRVFIDDGRIDWVDSDWAKAHSNFSGGDTQSPDQPTPPQGF